MAYEFILSDQDENGIVIVTINDPAAKNAVNWSLNRELFQEIQRIEADPTARALILTGSGQIFCSGGNIKTMTSQGKVLEQPHVTLREELFPHEADIRNVVISLRRMSKPAIAAVNGPAVGSGIGLAAGCDIRVAAETARFDWVFVRRGIVPDDASLALVQQIVGYVRAFEWGISGRSLGALQAKDIGFVNHVVPAESLLQKCREIALEIIQNCPPITVQAFKLALTESMSQSLEESVRFVARAQQAVSSTSDHREALRAYGEKRTPIWTGR